MTVSGLLSTIEVSADLLGVVTNVFEAVDIITLIKGNNYDELNLDVGEALKKRADVGQNFATVFM